MSRPFPTGRSASFFVWKVSPICIVSVWRMGALPSTVTVSCVDATPNVCTPIEEARPALVPTLLTCVLLKPGASRVTLYVPTGRPRNSNAPTALVFAVNGVLVPLSTAVTLAPGITCCCWSCTVPVIDPVVIPCPTNSGSTHSSAAKRMLARGISRAKSVLKDPDLICVTIS